MFLLAPSRSLKVFGDEFGRIGNLIILVKSNKPAYEVGEPIFLTLTLKNHTTVPLLVNQRFHYEQDLEIDLFYESFGNIPLKPFPAKPLSPEDYARLEVNESISVTLPDLLEIAAVPLKEGRFALRVFYRNGQNPTGKEAWTGRIVTNQIWFTVKASEKI